MAWEEYAKGEKLYKEKKYTEALSCFDKCIELDSSYVYAHYNKGISLKNLKRYEEALSCYDECIRLDPTYVDAYNGKGNAYYDLKRYEEALSCYDKCIELDSSFVYAYNGKGNALNGLKRYEEALSCYDKCIELDSSYVYAYHGKGVALNGLKRYGEALICFNQCIILDSTYVNARTMRDIILKELEEKNETVLCFEKCLQLDSNFILNSNQSEKEVFLLVGKEDFNQMVTWFQTTLELKEIEARQYSLQLFNEGIYSVNILNTCRRLQLFDPDQLTRMRLPRPIRSFLLTSPDEPVENHSHITDLKEWMRLSLGVQNPPLLDSLFQAVKSNQYWYSLPLLRADNELICEDLLDGSVIFNKFVAQTLVESLNFEREMKRNSAPPPKSSSLCPCEKESFHLKILEKLHDVIQHSMKECLNFTETKTKSFLGKCVKQFDKKINKVKETLTDTVESGCYSLMCGLQRLVGMESKGGT